MPSSSQGGKNKALSAPTGGGRNIEGTFSLLLVLNEDCHTNGLAVDMPSNQDWFKCDPTDVM
jgi:hypothetical protein